MPTPNFHKVDGTVINFTNVRTIEIKSIDMGKNKFALVITDNPPPSQPIMVMHFKTRDEAEQKLDEIHAMIQPTHEHSATEHLLDITTKLVVATRATGRTHISKANIQDDIRLASQIVETFFEAIFSEKINQIPPSLPPS